MTTKESFMTSFQSAMGQVLQISMRSFWRYTRKRGLTMPQMFALRYIYYKGESNISDIAKELGVTGAAASQMLDRLVGQRLILRQEDPHDRRNKRLTLTQGGRGLLRESAESQCQWLDALFASMSPDELEKVTEAMDILTERTSDLVEAQPGNKSPREEPCQ